MGSRGRTRRATMIKSHPKLNDQEFLQAKEAFMLYDTSGDEKLDSKEIGQLLRALGMTPTHLQVREIIREFDKDKSGTIEFNEFLDLYATHKAPPTESKELLEAFKVFDKNGTGQISAADAGRSAARGAGEGAHCDAGQERRRVHLD